ncbi:MAG: hypothetical protein JKY17_02640 [Magnetovibrio sp.]|nr:hypothetical protein [Magnetovibrio sp.]
MPKLFCRLAVTTILCGAVGVPFSAFAQNDQNNGRYGAWNNQSLAPVKSAQKNDLQGFLNALKALTREAERDRAANPVFLRDLKNLAARYEHPLSVRIIFDDFKDGDYIRNPQWSVTSGEYRVERGYGLRNQVIMATTNEPVSTPKMNRKKLAMTILGAVLNGNKRKTDSAPPLPPIPVKAASITTRARIPNAFALSTDISSWKSQGRYEIALTQGTSGSGYRLAYRPGVAGALAKLDLIKVTTRGQSVIDHTALPSLEDQRSHTIAWTRNMGGLMIVTVDGKSSLKARDQTFRDGFNRLLLTSDGTDVIVKSISVMGVR